MYNCKNYKEIGGDKWVVGGEFEVNGVNLINVINAIAGDIILQATPATLGSSSAEVATAIAGEELKFTRDVELKLVATDGSVHNWYNGTMNIAATETTAGDGTSAISESATSVTFAKGVATVTLEYIGTWSEGDTQTLTVTGGSILGYTIADKTSVDTLIA